MEITNFSGQPIEIIKYYIYNFNNMDEQTKSNFSNLVTTIINGSDVMTLIDLYSELDYDVLNAEDKINTLTLEMTSRKGKMESSSELEQIAQDRGTTSGDELVRMSNEYKNKEVELKKVKHIKGMSFGICSHINDSILNQIKSLSIEERATLPSKLSTKFKTCEDRINTLTLEMTSRKGKMESSSELEQIAQDNGTTKENILTILNREYREKWYETKYLEHSINIYNKYYEIIYNISKQK